MVYLTRLQLVGEDWSRNVFRHSMNGFGSCSICGFDMTAFEHSVHGMYGFSVANGSVRLMPFLQRPKRMMIWSATFQLAL